MTLGGLGGSLWCGFVNYDDDVYVTANADITHGFTLPMIRSVMTHRVESLYHPVTFLSYALDVQLFGMGPAGFHLTNLLLHCANVVLLYRLFLQLTDAPWRCATLAAIWAVHPLRVESVVWITERKDVLLGFFGFASLYFYISYVHQRGMIRYALACFFLILSLLSKPVFLVMPAILLLLDIWPLRRTQLLRSRGPSIIESWRSLLIEKIPLAMICVIDFVAYAWGIANANVRPPNSAGPPTMWTVTQNGLTASAWYVLSTFDFRHLSVFYPVPLTWPLKNVIGSAIFLAIITCIAVRQFKLRPWILIGWLWFIASLLPISGILFPQSHSRADRYTYIPSIGLLLAMIWSLPAAWFVAKSRKIILATGVIGLVVGLAIVSEWNIRYWRDSEMLWAHTLAVTNDNWMAEHNYASALAQRGETIEAIPHFQKAVRLNPGWAFGHFNYANALMELGDNDHALAEYRKSIRLAPPPSDAGPRPQLRMKNGQDLDVTEVLRSAASSSDSSP